MPPHRRLIRSHPSGRPFGPASRPSSHAAAFAHVVPDVSSVSDSFSDYQPHHSITQVSHFPTLSIPIPSLCACRWTRSFQIEKDCHPWKGAVDPFWGMDFHLFVWMTSRWAEFSNPSTPRFLYSNDVIWIEMFTVTKKTELPPRPQTATIDALQLMPEFKRLVDCIRRGDLIPLSTSASGNPFSQRFSFTALILFWFWHSTNKRCCDWEPRPSQQKKNSSRNRRRSVVVVVWFGHSPVTVRYQMDSRVYRRVSWKTKIVAVHDLSWWYSSDKNNSRPIDWGWKSI